MSNLAIPFGMLFEEQQEADLSKLVTPEYDPIDGISYITDSKGKRIPFLHWAHEAFATQSQTNVRAEITDTDPTDDRSRIITTQTITKVKGETTDTD